MLRRGLRQCRRMATRATGLRQRELGQPPGPRLMLPVMLLVLKVLLLLVVLLRASDRGWAAPRQRMLAALPVPVLHQRARGGGGAAGCARC